MIGQSSRLPEIITWRYDQPHAFYLISNKDAKTIAARLHDLAGGKGRFIVSEITDNSSGWITTESWYLIQNKQQKPNA
jgi:hypothetical protein